MDSEARQHGWTKFLELCHEAESIENLAQIMAFFLTYEEKEHVADRMIIIENLLNANCSQRVLAQKFGISIAKITRGSNALKTLDAEIKNQLKVKLSQKEC